MTKPGHTAGWGGTGRWRGNTRSAFETAGLLHGWVTALDFLRVAFLAEVTTPALEGGTFFCLVSMPRVYLSTFLRVSSRGSITSQFRAPWGHPMRPFLETLPAPPSCSGHSGSGKTEAAKKMVQFLHSLAQEQTRDRGCQVRAGWPFSRDLRGTFLLWARTVVSGLWFVLGLPRALPAVVRGGRSRVTGLPWTCLVPRHRVSSAGLLISGHHCCSWGYLNALPPSSWMTSCLCLAALATPRQSSMPTPAASARSHASTCSSE